VDLKMAGAERKLERAQEHIVAVHAIVDQWLRSEALTIEEVPDMSTGRTERRVRLGAAPPDRLALVIGDAVHNLRAALDHAVYDAACQHAGGALTPQVEKALMFPVIGDGTKKEFDREAGKRLVGVPNEVIAVVEQAQPYRWNDAGNPGGYCFHPVWQVHELDRIDKHRRLTVTAAALESQAIGVPDNVEPDVEFHYASGPVTDEQVLASYLGADAGVEYLFDRSVVVTDGQIGVRDVAVGDLLKTLLQHIAHVVWRTRNAAGN
jgi:hypothetical protein